MPTRDIKPAPSVGSWYKGTGCIRETREVLRGRAGRVCRGPPPTLVLLATASDSDTELGHLHEQGDLSLEPLQAYYSTPDLCEQGGTWSQSLHALIPPSSSLGPAGALRQVTEAASYREGIRPSQSLWKTEGCDMESP